MNQVATKGLKDLKGPQMTSKDLQRPQKIELFKPISNADSIITGTLIKKNELEVGSVQKFGEVNA